MTSQAAERVLGARVRNRGPAPEREGAVALLAAILITVLLGFAALAVDLSTKYRVRSESQNAVDAAALAGARELDGTPDRFAIATAQAIAIGNQHYAYADDVALSDANVELGNWDLQTRTFTTPATSASTTNAVRVTYTEASVAHPFAAPLTGTGSSPVGASAIALGGGPSVVECAFPLSLGSCTIQPNEDAALQCGGCLTMGRATGDTVGWSNLNANPSSANLGPIVETACGSDGNWLIDDEGNCTGACQSNTPEVGERTNVANGNNMNQNATQFCERVKDALNASPTGTIRVQVPVFREESSPCNPRFTGDPIIIGYAQAEILGISCRNNDPTAVVPPNNTCTTPGGTWMVARIECDIQEDTPAGGGFFGVSARPVLVD